MKPTGPRERGLLGRENWPNYIAGMLAESAFILALTALAYLMAVVAKAVF